MKKMILWALAITLSATAYAQSDSTRTASDVKLKEAGVKATRTVARQDGLLILPTERQKTSSTNGFSLLAKAAMPMIRVDEVKHSVSAVDNKGVQIRLNGALATTADLLALDPKLVRSIEYLDNPGVRYGDGIGYVINIRSRRADEGYALGLDLTQALTTRYGDDMAYARWNHHNSEWGLTYDFGYNDARRTRQREDADYLLSDGTHEFINRQDTARRDRSFSNHLQLKYNLADSGSYVFQATLSGDFRHSPTGYKYRRFEEGTTSLMTLQRNRGKSFSPVLDLYFFHTLGRHQSLTANVVGTSIATDRYYFNNEGSNYAYTVDGNTWSLTSEAVYENRLKPFTWTSGINHRWKYTRNAYRGDVMSTNNMHNSNLYLFSQIRGTLGGNLHYTAGMGMSCVRYRQGQNSYNYWLFRPKATLGYQLTKRLGITYDFEVTQHISQIAMISDTRIRTNALEYTVGNPGIRPNSVRTHALRLAYSKPRLYSQLYAEYRQNRKTNMASYERTDEDVFLYRQKNQPHVNMFYVSNYTHLDLVADVLTASFSGGIYRYFNKGDDYNHLLTSYNIGGSLQAYIGRWTLTCQLDNGWKFQEGETTNRRGLGNALQCSYRFGNCRLSLTWDHPFEAHPKTNHARLINRYLHKDILLRSGDDGNALYLNFSWKLNRGRRYKDIRRTMQNKDTQTGIL